MSEDITFCYADCNLLRCARNKKNIREYWMDHSFAYFEGDPNYCPKADGTIRITQGRRRTSSGPAGHLPQRGKA